MKNLRIKISLICVLAFLTLAMAFLSVVSLTTVKAATPADTFAMTSKASVRIDNKSGLRFKVQIGSDIKTRIDQESAELGFLVFPQEYLLGADGVKGNADDITGDYVNTLPQKKQETVNKGKIYSDDDGGYYANIVLVDILTENFDKEFTAIAYLKEDSSYTYATFDSDFSRSINYVAEREILVNPDMAGNVQGVYTHIGTTNHPVSITGASDYNIIATNVAGGKTYENVHFQLTDDFTLPQGYTSIGATFAGTIDGNNKTVETSTNGEIAKFAEDMSLVTNLTFNAVASTVLSVNSGVEARVTGEKVTASYVAADATEIAGFSGDYSGNAIKVAFDNVGMHSFSLEFSGVAPSDKEYVHFWLAGNYSGVKIGCDEIFYMINEYGTDSIPVQAAVADIDCLAFFDTLKNVGKWVEYYCPIEVFNSYMKGEYAAAQGQTPIAKTSMDFKAYGSNKWTGVNGVGGCLYIGDITFVDKTWAEAEEQDATIFGPLYKKEYRTYAYKPSLQTVEFVDPNKIVTYYTQEQMVDKGFTGATAAIDVSGRLVNCSSLYYDYCLDVSNYSVDQINALDDTYTHLEVSFGFKNIDGNSSPNRIDGYVNCGKAASSLGIAANTKPLLTTTELGTLTNNSVKWGTYKILIADFIELALTAKNTFLGKYQNQVPLLSSTIREGSTFEIYMGEMKFAFDQAEKDHFENSELTSNGFTNTVGYTGALDRYELEYEVSGGSNIALLFDVSDFNVDILNDYTEIEIFFAWDIPSISALGRVMFANDSFVWGGDNKPLVQPASRYEGTQVINESKQIKKFTLDIDDVKTLFNRAKSSTEEWNKNQVKIINFFSDNAANENIVIWLGAITLKNTSTSQTLSLIGRSDLPILTKISNGNLL